MSEFINTIDVLGDDAVIDSIIDRTITEFNDNVIQKLGASAFRECTALRSVNLPNVMTADNDVLRNNPALERVVLGVNQIPGWAFVSDSSLKEAVFPRATSIGICTFQHCNAIELLDFHALTNFPGGTYLSGDWVKHVVIRTPSVCSVHASTAFGKRTRIYVPASLVDSYKANTNWSTHADYFRPLEEYTVEGTVDGELCIRNVNYQLRGVSSSNMENYIGRSYRTTLTSNTAYPMEVVVTMGDVDVTSSAYNPTTREVAIETVTGDIVINAKIVVPNVTIVKSLNSDGASRIVTDFVPDATTVFTFEGYDEAQETAYEQFFTLNGNNAFSAARSHWNKFVTVCGKHFQPCKPVNENFASPFGIYVQIDLVNQTASVNNLSSNSISVNANWTQPLVLFSNSNKFKLYRASATQNGVLTHEWLPARDSSGRACLYDSVQNKFLYNAGTGTFTCDV